ncbi:DUF4345 family protein [Arthrobacter sp. Ld5]|uniref:DUF4345 domain-containing protein n=1 Tax=Arthrobacter sp. Ld5 TaxID=649152 RepID=UPI003EBD380A
MTSTSPEHDDPSTPGGRPTRPAPSTPRASTPASGTAGPAPSGTTARTSGDGAPATGKKAGRTASTGGDWNVFRTVVVLLGLALAAFGVYYLVFGTAGLPDSDGTPVNPTLESQFRFYSAMMVGVGAAFITIAIKFQWANMLWLVCLMVFFGGIGRVLSWAFSGTPNYLMIILMVIELAFPAALLVWHKYIAKTTELRREFAQGS